MFHHQFAGTTPKNFYRLQNSFNLLSSTFSTKVVLPKLDLHFKIFSWLQANLFLNFSALKTLLTINVI